MAIFQISRIQHRRGLQQDLPQLASAELGWSVDTRRLYIGNGTLEEGAPTTGITEILTEYSDLNSIVRSLTPYTFYGNIAGYTAQSGPSLLSPITRTYSEKLDDFVSIRDFGAVGDGITDDTEAINRAIQEVYKTGYTETSPLARRTIYFPGGTYLVSSDILIPPYARIVGDGLSSSIIRQTRGNRTFIISDSKFQTGAAIGTNGATLPRDIEINGVQFFNSNTSPTQTLFSIDSTSNVSIKNVAFVGNAAGGFNVNLVSIATSVRESHNITFDSCKFLTAARAIGYSSPSVNAVRVSNSVFDRITQSAMALCGGSSISSTNNYFGNVTSQITDVAATSMVTRFGDYSYVNSAANAGLFLGNYQVTPSVYYTISDTPTVISLVANSESIIDYTISNSSGRRVGTMLVTTQASETVWSDDYSATSVSPSANLFVGSGGLVATSETPAVFQYSIKRFRTL